MKWHHCGIQAADLRNAISFYEQLFGFTVEARLSLVDEEIAFLKRDGITIELVQGEVGPAKAGSLHMAWQVDHLDKWMKSLGQMNVHPAEGPFHLENGWKVAFFKGSNDEVIELMEIG
ncbi:VOC family protein [Falsibacillus albus]|uniref:VOC family protein n=1 Tax=Falsibacillus albus TaxID=2478915 RepID=UPI0013146975|nr:VOC family protein [Falsibacillus albus]